MVFVRFLSRYVLLSPLRRASGSPRWSDPPKPLDKYVVYKGQNLPFNLANHRALAIKFLFFFAIPFSTPFFIVRYHLIKASGGGKGGKPKTGGEESANVKK